MNEITSLLKRLNINYKNQDFYLEALTHASYNNESNYDKNYQRLEFLGDAILQQYISIFLYKKFKLAGEGEMSLLRSKIVRNDHLIVLSKNLNFEKYIRIGKGIKYISDKILVDVFEAMIGAIYIDRGNREVQKFLNKIIFEKIKSDDIKDNKDPKTVLQEYLQSESRKNIYYHVENVENGFKASIFYNQKLFGQGIGETKKKAETNAAQDALSKLSTNNEVN